MYIHFKFTWSTIENLKSKEYSLVQNEDELSQECDPWVGLEIVLVKPISWDGFPAVIFWKRFALIILQKYYNYNATMFGAGSPGSIS